MGEKCFKPIMRGITGKKKRKLGVIVGKHLVRKRKIFRGTKCSLLTLGPMPSYGGMEKMIEKCQDSGQIGQELPVVQSTTPGKT